MEENYSDKNYLNLIYISSFYAMKTNTIEDLLMYLKESTLECKFVSHFGIAPKLKKVDEDTYKVKQMPL